MPKQRIYALDWSGKRLAEMMAAVNCPRADFMQAMGIGENGMDRWLEDRVPKKFVKRVARLLGWNLVYPDWPEAPLGTWVTKKPTIEPPDDGDDGFEVKPTVEKIMAPSPAIPTAPIVAQPVRPVVNELTRPTPVEVPTLATQQKPKLVFRND
jgi:hypothetical protein